MKIDEQQNEKIELITTNNVNKLLKACPRIVALLTITTAVVTIWLNVVNNFLTEGFSRYYKLGISNLKIDTTSYWENLGAGLLLLLILAMVAFVINIGTKNNLNLVFLYLYVWTMISLLISLSYLFEVSFSYSWKIVFCSLCAVAITVVAHITFVVCLRYKLENVEMLKNRIELVEYVIAILTIILLLCFYSLIGVKELLYIRGLSFFLVLIIMPMTIPYVVTRRWDKEKKKLTKKENTLFTNIMFQTYLFIGIFIIAIAPISVLTILDFKNSILTSGENMAKEQNEHMIVYDDLENENSKKSLILETKDNDKILVEITNGGYDKEKGIQVYEVTGGKFTYFTETQGKTIINEKCEIVVK